MSKKNDAAKDIIMSLEYIDDELIAEYDTFEAKSADKTVGRAEFIKCFSAIAACLIIVISLAVGSIYSHYYAPDINHNSPGADDPLPAETEKSGEFLGNNSLYVQNVLQNAYYVEVNSLSDSVAWLSGALSDGMVSVNDNIQSTLGFKVDFDCAENKNPGAVLPDDNSFPEEPKLDDITSESVASTNATEGTWSDNFTGSGSYNSSANKVLRDSLNKATIPYVELAGSLQPSTVQMGFSANANIEKPDLIPYIRYGYKLDSLGYLSSTLGTDSVSSIELGVSFRFLNNAQNQAYSNRFSDGRDALGYLDTGKNASVVFDGNTLDAYFCCYNDKNRSVGYITFYSAQYKCEVEISVDISGKLLPTKDIHTYLEEITKKLKLITGEK